MTLRFFATEPEEGDARLIFRFTTVCEANTVQDQQDAYLLVAAARMVRHLGAARRRGRGQCRLKLVEATGLLLKPDTLTLTKEALSQFRTNWLTPLTESVSASDEAEKAQPFTLTGQMKRFRLVGQLREPLLVAQRSEAANAYETLPLVPGTAVLGALATRAARQLDLQKSATTPTEFVDLFLRGVVQTSNLTLAAVTDNDELFPTIVAPRSFFQCENYPAFQKDENDTGHTLHNGLTGKPPAECSDKHDDQICGGKVKAVNGFVQINEAQISHTPQKREEMHIKMDRATGRAKEGDLYEYIVLEAGQWVAGELQCDSGAWSRLQTLTGLALNEKSQIRLGKASRRGYGLLEFVLKEVDENEPPLTIAQPFASRFSPAIDAAKETQITLSLLLLSDMIMCDRWGRYYGGFDATWLQDVFGKSAQSVTLDEQYCSSRIVDSFNGHRRSPRWRDEAIEAGSVAQVTIDTNDLPALLARLKELETRGVGLRTAEGFGQIAFNHLLLHPSAQVTDGINVKDVTDILNPRSARRAVEVAFRTEWTELLITKNWKVIDKLDYDALARLLFIYRYQNIDELLRWLEWKDGSSRYLSNATNLWGGDKQLNGGDKEPRLSKAGLAFITKLIEQLKEGSKEQQAIGLELLANRLSDEAIKAKGADA